MVTSELDILLSETENEDVMIGFINASAETVWNLIADFESTSKWIPAIVESKTISSDNEHIRTLRLDNGSVIKEKLLTLDEKKRIFSFQILESPLPLAGYRSTMTVYGLSKEQCYLVWTSVYPENTPDEAKKASKAIHEIGYAGLRKATEKS